MFINKLLSATNVFTVECTAVGCLQVACEKLPCVARSLRYKSMMSAFQFPVAFFYFFQFF